MKRQLPWALFAGGILAISSSRSSAVTAVSNIDNPDTPFSHTMLTASVTFTTGDTPATLLSISAPYFCTSSFGMETFGSVVGPGGVSETFPDQLDPFGHGTATFHSAGLTLTPHTTYSFYFGCHTTAAWTETTLTSETSAYGWTIGDHIQEDPTINAVGRLSIDVTFTPEPSTLALAALPCIALRRRHRHTPAA